MDYEEIICVHLNLKFIILKNIEKDDNCLCDDFAINLPDVNDIDSSNSSKGYFIKKFHGLLKKRKKNEYECVISGTLNEIANFLYEHIELFIEIKKEEKRSKENVDDYVDNVKVIERNGKQNKDENKRRDYHHIDDDKINYNNCHSDNNDNYCNDNYTSEEVLKRKNKNIFSYEEKKLDKNKIHLLKSVDMHDNLNFENESIYFKCLFSDLINDFEYIQNKKYENISNFYISSDLIFSICLKLEEHLIEKEDLQKIYLKNDNNIHMKLEKYDNKYKHVLNLFYMNSIFYLYVNFNQYNKQFFLDNDIEVAIGETIQNVSEKVRLSDDNSRGGDIQIGLREQHVINNMKEKRENLYRENKEEKYDNISDHNNNNNMDNINNMRDIKNDKLNHGIHNFNTGCHFSLILVDNIKELADYFYINNFCLHFNGIKLYVDKKGIFTFDHIKNKTEVKDQWVFYKDSKKITYNLNTLNSINNNDKPINIRASIISIFLNTSINNGMDSFGYSSSSIVHHPYNIDESYNNNESLYKDIMNDGVSPIVVNNDMTTSNMNNAIYNMIPNVMPNTICNMMCNFFVSVNNCHILELSNIYAEKRKKNENEFYLKMESDLFDEKFKSELYLFRENAKIEFKDCYVNHNFEVKDEEELYHNLEGRKLFFELYMKEKESEINIGIGEFHINNIISELNEIMIKKKCPHYYKFNYRVCLYLNVFKEKYLTSELNVEIYVSLKEDILLNSCMRGINKNKDTNKNIKYNNNKNDGDDNIYGNHHVVDINSNNNNYNNYNNNNLNSIQNNYNDNFKNLSSHTTNTTHFNTKNIPKNIYEFKIWKEKEEDMMRNILKKKEEQLIRKFSKKYEIMEKERKSEFEKKKNELKEIIIKMKEEQINIINNKNMLKLKDKELNEEIYSLEKKLKKIKYVYEKSLYTFKEKLKKNELNESVIKENDELRNNYKKVIKENRFLLKEKDHMKNMLNKYNHKDNVIISKTYFQQINQELKYFKENNTNNLLLLNNKKYNENIQSYIKMIHKNRKKSLQHISNFIIQLENIYDLINNEIVEQQFHNILKSINDIKYILNDEIKQEKNIMDILSLSQSPKLMKTKNNDHYISNSYMLKEKQNEKVLQNDTLFEEHIYKYNHPQHKEKKNQKEEEKEQQQEQQHNNNNNNNNTFKDNPLNNKKEILLPCVDKKKKLNNIYTSKDEKKIKNTKLFMVKDKSNVVTKKIHDKKNNKVIENLKSEISRLIQTGIYNEDDEIIISMKKKLNALVN